MNNEITVKLKCNIEEICKILENKEFQFVEKYLLDDSYYIPSTINIKEMSEREILSKAIILRNIEAIFQNIKTVNLHISIKNLIKMEI